MSTMETLLAALRSHRLEPRPSGSGWTCKCPAHDDRSPSLSIDAGDDGRTLVHCFAGCQPEAVVGAVGLTLSDLYPADNGPSRNGRTPKPKGGNPKMGKPKGARAHGFGSGDAGPIFPTAAAAVADYEKRHGPRAGQWTYRDPRGEPIALAVRWNKRDGSKMVLPFSAVAGGWVQRALPSPRPLYRLPELLALPAGSRVWLFEGEKSADAGAALGLASTTASGGAKGAAKADWSPLAGHDVIVSVDHNEPGERYGRDAAAGALAAGAWSVRIVRLAEHYPDLPDGGDVVDALELEGGDAEAVRAVLERLAAEAEPVEREGPEPERAPVFEPELLFPAACACVRDFVAEVSRSSQTPPEMAATLALAVASGCIANVAQVRGYGDHVEPAQIWGLVLSDSGTRKSAVLRELAAPVFAWEREQADAMRPEIAEAAQQRKIAEKRLRWLENRAAKESNGEKRDGHQREAVELAQRLEAEPVPKPPVLVACEPTPEALAKQMAENHGRALLASAEADAIDIVQGRYSGQRNYGILLKGHSGDAVRVHRIGRESDVIDRPALAVALIVQPAAVEDFFTDRQAEGRGMLARFAVVAAPNLLGSRDVRPEPVRPALRKAWDVALRGLLRLRPSDEPPIVQLSSDADAIFLEYQRRTEAALGFGDLADRAEWGGKLCGLVLRVALTLHALANWTRSGSPTDADRIDADTMRCAVAWGDFLATAERHARGRIAETPQDREQSKLIAWIRGRGGSVTVRELSHGLRRFRRDSAGAERALGELVTARFGKWEIDTPGPKGGRPTKRFHLAEPVTVTETPRHTPAEAGSGDGDTPRQSETDLNDGDEWGTL